MLQVEHAVQGPPTGSSGHKVPYLDVANTWSAAQVISGPVAGPILTISTPDAGSTGTWLDMFTDSASPAAFDTAALIRFAGRNSTSGFTQYATIFNILVDPTAGNETSYLWFGTTLNGAQGNRMILGQGLYTFNAAGGDKGPNTINATTLYEAGTNLASKYGQLAVDNYWSGKQAIVGTTANQSFITLTTTDPGYPTGPGLSLFRDSASPAANDWLGFIVLGGRGATLNAINYGQIQVDLIDPTVGSEDGALDFLTMIAGTPGTRLLIGAGLYTPGATGGDKGPDTINATTLYEAGVSLATKYAALGNANTWTANQIISPPAVGVPLTIISTLAGTLLSLQSSNAGTNAGPLIDLFRDKTGPAANDSIGQIEFSGRNSSASVKNYAGIVGKIISPTAGAESSAVSIYAFSAGVVNTLFFGAGLYTSGVSGGDKGANTVNATTLYEAGVSIATKYAALGNANTWTAAQIFDSGSIAPITVRWTDGTQFVGPDLKITRASPTPAASDFIGRVLFEGFNASLATISYSSVQAQITDPTVGSESVTLYFNTYAGGSGATRLTMALGVFVGAATGGDKGAGTINATALYEAGVSIATKYGALASANTWTAGQTITVTDTSTVLQLISTDAGALNAPGAIFYRDSASPASADQLAQIFFHGRNSLNVVTEYAGIQVAITDVTSGSEDGRIFFRTVVAGTPATRVRIQAGLYTGAAADMGVDTINAQSGLYEAGVALTAKYGQLAVNNAWSAQQNISTAGSGVSPLTLINVDNAIAVQSPILDLFRETNAPTAGQGIGQVRFQSRDSAATQIVYAGVLGVIGVPTAGAATGLLALQTRQANVNSTRMYVGLGLFTIGVTGQDKGADTINATTLYEAGVALTAKYGQLAANNVWTGTQQINSTIVNTVLSMSTTDAGASGGPTMTLDRASASPAVNDVLGVINFFGRDSTNVITGYNQIFGYIVDPTDTSEDSGLYLYTYQAGALIQNLVLSNGNAQVQSIDQGSSGFPLFDLSRGTSSPAAGDNFGTHRWLIPNTSATVIAAINLVGYFDDPTAGSEDARFLFQTYVAGANGNRVFIGAGLYVPGVVDPGVGNIHGVTLWEGGGPIAARYIPGGRNLARRNGQFLVWQRGAGGSAVFAVPASTIAYTADGWYLATNALQACTVTQAGPLGLWASQFSAKVQRNAGQTGVAPMRFGFPLDTDELWPGLGELVRLSYTVVAGANWSPASGLFSAVLYTGTGAPVKFAAGFTGGVQLLTQNSNITTTATRYSATAPSIIASNSRQVEIDFIWTPVGTAGADDSFTVTDVMLEVVKDQNQVSSPMERLLFSDAQQLCMRHYQKTHAYSIAPGSIGPPTGELHFQAGITGAVVGYYAFKPPVWMRAGPTVVIQNPDVVNNQIRNASLALDFTGSALVYGLGNEILISGTGTSGATVPNLIRFNLTLDASI